MIGLTTVPFDSEMTILPRLPWRLLPARLPRRQPDAQLQMPRRQPMRSSKCRWRPPTRSFRTASVDISGRLSGVLSGVGGSSAPLPTHSTLLDGLEDGDAVDLGIADDG